MSSEKKHARAFEHLATLSETTEIELPSAQEILERAYSQAEEAHRRYVAECLYYGHKPTLTVSDLVMYSENPDALIQRIRQAAAMGKPEKKSLRYASKAITQVFGSIS